MKTKQPRIPSHASQSRQPDVLFITPKHAFYITHHIYNARGLQGAQTTLYGFLVIHLGVHISIVSAWGLDGQLSVIFVSGVLTTTYLRDCITLS